MKSISINHVDKTLGTPSDWLKFNTRDFSQDSRREFCNKHKELLRKEIEGPKALDYAEFSTLHEGSALQNLDQFCYVSYRHDDRTFTSQAWNRLFRIQEQVVREYVMEFMSSFKFRDHVMELDIVDTVDELDNNPFEFFYDACIRNRPNNYNPTEYFIEISIRNHYDTRHPPSYTIIKNPTRRLVYRIVTLGPETSLLSVAKLVDLGISRYNGLGLGELVDDQLDNSGDEAASAEARRAHDEAGGVRRHLDMSFTNRLRAMDDKLGDIDTNIYKLSNDVEDLTYVVSGMSEQYDQFYEEFRQMKMEQERFRNWNTDHLSQLLAYHHIDHTRYDGTRYSHVLNIPDLGVQQGVNFMSSPQVFSTAPTASPNLFGYFDASGAGTSTSQNPRNDMDEE
ncbi:hypothetical protein Tco_0513399 [Tanacetum coccineum]